MHNLFKLTPDEARETETNNPKLKKFLNWYATCKTDPEMESVVT